MWKRGNRSQGYNGFFPFHFMCHVSTNRPIGRKI
jgi:hypothetical protein